jgi:hypothetical protein
MQPGTSVLTFKAEYETNVINYERCSRTKHWSGLDTDEYEISNVCTLFSAMPWHRDLATKFYRKQVSDPTSVGLTYLWNKADQMNEAYERSLTDNLAKKFKTAESINTVSAIPPPPPNPDLRYSGSGLQQGWNSSERAGGKSGKGSSGLKGGGGSWKGKGRGKGESSTFARKGTAVPSRERGHTLEAKGRMRARRLLGTPPKIRAAANRLVTARLGHPATARERPPRTGRTDGQKTARRAPIGIDRPHQ